MTPTAAPLTDDSDKARAILEDLLKFCQHWRVGLFPRTEPNLHIAIAEPYGDAMPAGYTHSKQTTPMSRPLVKRWEDIARIDYLRHMPRQVDTLKMVRKAEILDAMSQCMGHYHCALIPYVISGDPMLLLCDKDANQQWRCFAVVAEMNCYGWCDRAIQARVQ